MLWAKLHTKCLITPWKSYTASHILCKLHNVCKIHRPFSWKFYTWQKKFTQAPPVVPVTNMRYVNQLFRLHNVKFTCFLCTVKYSGREILVEDLIQGLKARVTNRYKCLSCVCYVPFHPQRNPAQVFFCTMYVHISIRPITQHCKVKFCSKYHYIP